MVTHHVRVDLAVLAQLGGGGTGLVTQIEVDLASRVVAERVRETRHRGGEERRIELVLDWRS